MNISQWLDIFKSAWMSHDVQAVMSIFSDEVEYWETPHIRLAGHDDIEKEWQVINNQTDIRLQTNVVLSQNDTHTVLWKLSYRDADNCLKQWGGIYIIQLATDGKCCYFYQTGEELK